MGRDCLRYWRNIQERYRTFIILMGFLYWCCHLITSSTVYVVLLICTHHNEKENLNIYYETRPQNSSIQSFNNDQLSVYDVSQYAFILCWFSTCWCHIPMRTICLFEAGKHRSINSKNDRVLSDTNINFPTQFERSHVQTSVTNNERIMEGNYQLVFVLMFR